MSQLIDILTGGRREGRHPGEPRQWRGSCGSQHRRTRLQRGTGSMDGTSERLGAFWQTIMEWPVREWERLRFRELRERLLQRRERSQATSTTGLDLNRRAAFLQALYTPTFPLPAQRHDC